jgi:SAM-dependent methyltransferase
LSEINPGGGFVPRTGDYPSELARYRRVGAHWKRYTFAASGYSSARVLDFGCGCGFGAAILASPRTEYLGVDADESAIMWAERYVRPAIPNASFRVESRPPPGPFDLITCFEVIEHVAEPDGLLDGLVSALSDMGVLLLSTPNGAFSAGNPRRFRSRFHVREYSGVELASWLSSKRLATRYFKEFRVDHLDVVGLTMGVPEKRTQREGVKSRAIEAFAEWFDDPHLWRIVSCSPDDLSSKDYSTIISEIHRR